MDWAVKRGLGKCRVATLHMKCEGPLAGGSFERYDGPVKDKVNFCFVCGSRSDAAVVIGGVPAVGVCKGHVEMLETFSKPGEKPAFVSHEYADIVG